MELEIDRERCVGGGMCALTAPRVFDQSEEDGLVVLTAPPEPEDLDAVREAVQLCPASALTLREE
ncbi:ferredoxin [Allostreptomyces psammosilenae]|uniref:Ferredoxin n=1 Tax=Allostreptomyces psammosilenae TaxID=1892865 RepID=A0A853A0L2_9ACTN|nr:ferredoxin [Allostreptomyces psammosilenae]NYI07915.1 ferredoxin [Allostreptomyces psammosilenae]